jgi:hypothetical protein
MLRYLPSDLHYGDVDDTTLPQGGSPWGPGCPDSSQPAVNTSANHSQRAQQLVRACASQLLPTNHTSHDLYPAQAQRQCSSSEQYAYSSSRPYSSRVNYSDPLHYFAENPVSIVPLFQQTEYSLTIIRSIRLTPTRVDTIPPMQLIPNILPLIPCLSIPPSMWGISPGTSLLFPTRGSKSVQPGARSFQLLTL